MSKARRARPMEKSLILKVSGELRVAEETQRGEEIAASWLSPDCAAHEAPKQTGLIPRQSDLSLNIGCDEGSGGSETLLVNGGHVSRLPSQVRVPDSIGFVETLP